MRARLSQRVQRRGRLRGGGLLNAQKLSHRHLEEPAQGDELFQFRQGGIALPFGNGLPGHAQFFPELLLGKAQFPAFGGDGLSDGHGGVPLCVC